MNRPRLPRTPPARRSGCTSRPALVIPASLLVFLPISLVAGIAVAAGLYLAIVVMLFATTPTVEVADGSCGRAGRASRSSSSRAPTGFTGAEAVAERGTRLDTRAWLVLRGWIDPSCGSRSTTRTIRRRTGWCRRVDPKNSPRRSTRSGSMPPEAALRAPSILAHRPELGVVVELRLVLDEEAVDAGELVSLRRQNDDIQVEVGEVCTDQLEAPGCRRHRRRRRRTVCRERAPEGPGWTPCPRRSSAVRRNRLPCPSISHVPRNQSAATVCKIRTG